MIDISALHVVACLGVYALAQIALGVFVGRAIALGAKRNETDQIGENQT